MEVWGEIRKVILANYTVCGQFENHQESVDNAANFRGSRLGYFAQSKDSGPIREVFYATLRVWGECVNNQDSGDLSCKY